MIDSPYVAARAGVYLVGAVFSQASAGEIHTCGRTDSGVAYCWGSNGAGELGIGSVDASRHDVPALVQPRPGGRGQLAVDALPEFPQAVTGIVTGGNGEFHPPFGKGRLQIQVIGLFPTA